MPAARYPLGLGRSWTPETNTYVHSGTRIRFLCAHIVGVCPGAMAVRVAYLTVREGRSSTHLVEMGSI